VPSSKGAPEFDHSAFVIAYTTDNLGHIIYPSGVSEADWLHDLPQLAKETWTGHSSYLILVAEHGTALYLLSR